MAKAVLQGLACALVAACSPYSSNGLFACTDNAQCDPGGTCSGGFCAFADSGCASGLKYGDLAGSLSNTCVGGGGSGSGKDAGVDSSRDAKVFMDAHVDSPPNQFCYGMSGLVQACFSAMPTGTVALTTAIDTDTYPCATVLGTSPGCVIAADAIMESGTVNVTGTKPLVLVAMIVIVVVVPTWIVAGAKVFVMVGASRGVMMT